MYLDAAGLVKANSDIWTDDLGGKTLHKTYFGIDLSVDKYVRVKVDGVWRKVAPYVKANGFWVPARPYKKTNGVWQRGSGLFGEFGDGGTLKGSFEGVTVDISIDISSIPDGKTIILAFNSDADKGTDPIPQGLVSLVPITTMYSRRVSVWAAKKESGFTSIPIDIQMVSSIGYVIVWGDFPPLSYWQIGKLELRAHYGASPRYHARCPSIEVDSPFSLVLAIAFEATNAVESPDSVTSYDNGFEQLEYREQGPNVYRTIETVWVGQKITMPGHTGITTVTWQNPQDTNGAGVHIVIPPLN